MPSPAPNLRPLTVGEILDASFKVYRRSFVTMAKAILIVAVPFGIVNALIRTSIQDSSSTLTTINPLTGQQEISAHVAAKFFGFTALSYVVTLIATAVATAVIYRVVGDVYLGHLPSWKEAVRGGLRKAPSVLWVTVLTAIGFALILAVPILLIVVLAAANVSGLAALFGVLTGIPAALAVIWFWVIAQLSVPTVMLENVRGIGAITRAGKLVRHLWWRSFGCMVLITLIVVILAAVVGGVFTALLLAFAKGTVAVVSVEFVVGLLTTVVFTPISACALLVLSIDLRVRKEGYDLHLLAQSLGTQPGSDALSFLPRPPVMWGGQGGWSQPGSQWGQGPNGSPPPPSGAQAWPPPQAQSPWSPPPPAGSQAWPPPPGQPSWSPPPPPPHPGQWTQPYAPGWGPPPPQQQPPPPPSPDTENWVPPGQPPPSVPPPLPHGPGQEGPASNGGS
jgi:hypothetical protein